MTHHHVTYEGPHLTYGGLIAEDNIRSTYQTEPSQIIDEKTSAMCIMAQIMLRETTAAGTTAVGSVVLSPLADMPISCVVGAAFGSVFLSAIGGVDSTFSRRKHAAIRTPQEIEHDVHVKLPPLDEWTAKARVVDIEDMKPFKVKTDTEHDVHVKLPPLDEWTAKARVVDIKDMKPFKVKRERAR